MSLNRFEEERLKGKKHEEETGQLKTGQHSNRSDKKLLLGTVQFYEDILESMQSTFVAIFNDSGKFIEVWGHETLKSIYGINPNEFKGKLAVDVFEKSVSENLTRKIQDVLSSDKRQQLEIKCHFPNGRFWLQVSLSPLTSEKKGNNAVIGYFQNITEAVNKDYEIEVHKEKYQRYFENAPDGIIFVNHKGIITSVNQSIQNFSGYRSDLFTGYKLTRLPFIKQQDVPKFQALIDSISEGTYPVNFELEWSNAAGLKIWSEVKTNFITKSGKVTGAQVVINDITERKLIENDLIKSKQAYKVIIENAKEAIFILQDDSIKFCNLHLLQLIGYSMDQVLETSFLKMIHNDDNEIVLNYLQKCYRGKYGKEELVFRLIDNQGNLKWVSSKAVLTEWDGSPALLLFSSDITKQKVAEDQEKKQIESIEYLSEKAIEFGELTEDYNVYKLLAEKINEITPNKGILVVSYDSVLNRSNIEHIEGSEEEKETLESILESNFGEFTRKFNHDLIKNISYGNLIKYNDGLFEYGLNIFPKTTFNLIRENLDIGGIYLIGLNYQKNVYGTLIIFLPKGARIANPEAVEVIAKLGSVALHRKNSWDHLRKNQEKFHQLFESYQDVYFRSDIDGIISEISPSVKQIGGYQPEEVIGKTIDKFFPDKKVLRKYAKILLREKTIADKDIQLLKKDGSIAYASLNARLLENKKGMPAGTEGFLRDITERKKMEEKFLKSEQKFRTLANFTYDWEYWISPEGKILYTSPSCERITGFKPEEFNKNPALLLDIVYEEDHEKFKYHIDFEEYNNKNDVLQLDFRIRTKKKEVKWISHICREVYDNDGNTLGRRISNRDITDRKLAEQELKNSEERFKTLFVKSPDAVFVENAEGIILDVNPAACDLLKQDKQNLTGKNILELIPPDKETSSTNGASTWTSSFKHFRGKAHAADGTIIPVDIHGSKIIFSTEEAYLFIVRDITDIVEKENSLKKSVEKAEEADMLKSAFLANVSHEIRTPMNAIIGFSEILTNEDLSQKEREEFINYITQGSNTLMNLIEDIIDITKIEAGQIKVNFSDCNVDELMDELYATFLKMKNKNDRSDVELRLNKPVTDKDLVISTDPNRIRQILSNLLGNAIKFTKKGHIELGFSIKNTGNIHFYVKDTGIGIPKDKIDFIFERFGQVEENKNHLKGTGLGLSISKKLAELLGGDLTVESTHGKGSKFVLKLPLDKELVDEAQLQEAIEKGYDWRNKLFLIAEDSILNYTFLEALFQKTGAKLLWAKNGKEAIDICKDNKDIDIVLMDIKMPVLSGLEAISEIKKFRPELPIIVQTAYAMPEDRDRSFAAGGDDHLTKPINPEELFSSIANFLK